MVDHDHNAIETIAVGEIRNEIASDLGKWGSILLSFDQNEAWGRQVGVDFHLLTNGTSCDIVLDEDRHFWPPVIALDKF